jgi:hypothetical protein
LDFHPSSAAKPHVCVAHFEKESGDRSPHSNNATFVTMLLNVTASLLLGQGRAAEKQEN